MTEITDKKLDVLREELGKIIPEHRYNHTLEVEKMALRLGRILAPDKIRILCAAALLHDITKHYTFDEQKEILEKYGLSMDKSDVFTEKIYHAITAAALIPEKYPDFANPEVISAVKWHTTGRADMTLCDEIVYFADYIDMSRKYPDCVTLREHFWDAEPEKMTYDERLKHFRRVLIESFDITLGILIKECSPICRDTVDARNYLILQK